MHNDQSHPKPIMLSPSSPNTPKYEIHMTYSTLTCALTITPCPSIVRIILTVTAVLIHTRPIHLVVGLLTLQTMKGAFLHMG